MVGSGLKDRPRVQLLDADSASGLADLLHQFLEQTVDASEAKANAARALRGEVVVRASEDEAIAVRIAFRGDQIELSDIGGQGPGSAPSITLSSAESVSTSMKCWCTMPMPSAMASREPPMRTARPSISISPLSA